MRVGRVALRSLALLAGLALGDWALGQILLEDGLLFGRPVAPFDPPLFSPAQRRALMGIEQALEGGEARAVRFDAELGWCNRPESGFGEFRYDWSGARIGAAPLARVKRPGVRRVVAVGCSMTHGEEVVAADAWCARIDAALEDLEVANLGVAAYGIDQALLRLRRDGWRLDPDEVWLGVMPQAALRVTTLFRPLLDHWSLDVAFKPRFELGQAGVLELVPNPARSLADVVHLLHEQRFLLDTFAGRDPWIARAPLAYAPRGSSWTHRSFTARVVLTALEKSGRDLATCFDQSGGFGRLYTSIVRSMARECAEKRATFHVFVLPGPDDLRQKREVGHGYWEDWAARLRSEGMSVIDCSSALMHPGDAGTNWFAPGGHYSSEASERVARALAEELAR